ncbi:MAG: hypothetical protein HQL45_00420 [Alphaproteobacteria bacterium]|nr:hypothetical protein [Alphaproteobacteria bacterium]
MPVLLCRSARPPKAGFDRWCAIAGAPEPSCLHPALKIKGLAKLLETAFDASVEEWWNIAQALGQEPSSVLAQTPSSAANISDFGLMLAWTRLADEWASGKDTVLLVCDDPWLFRHLTGRHGVADISSAPPLFWKEVKLKLRGFAARLAAGQRFAGWARQLAEQSQACPKDRPTILVYAHPASTAEGNDAYFGSLMKEMPELVRMIHVDGQPDSAQHLGKNGQSFSLHGFGKPDFARGLWKTRWRPVMSSNWLIRRAAMIEGATAQAAAIAWQIHCAQAWLEHAEPRMVAWPWENHSWERALVRAARTKRIRTLGYQHATVGWREWNYAPHSNPDGLQSLPDRILTVGSSDLSRLMRYGCPRHILAVGGALRFAKPPATKHDPAAPVFVALPFDSDIAGQMIDALRPLAEAGRHFLVKDHPMTPFHLQPERGIEPTENRLGEIDAVSAVLYCLTTVGLESVLAGLPTLRFLPEGKVPVDVMPDGVAIAETDAATLGAALEKLTLPPAIDAASVFAPADTAFWQEAFRA